MARPSLAVRLLLLVFFLLRLFGRRFRVPQDVQCSSRLFRTVLSLFLAVYLLSLFLLRLLLLLRLFRHAELLPAVVTQVVLGLTRGLGRFRLRFLRFPGILLNFASSSLLSLVFLILVAPLRLHELLNSAPRTSDNLDLLETFERVSLLVFVVSTILVALATLATLNTLGALTGLSRDPGHNVDPSQLQFARPNRVPGPGCNPRTGTHPRPRLLQIKRLHAPLLVAGPLLLQLLAGGPLLLGLALLHRLQKLTVVLCLDDQFVLPVEELQNERLFAHRRRVEAALVQHHPDAPEAPELLRERPEVQRRASLHTEIKLYVRKTRGILRQLPQQPPEAPVARSHEEPARTGRCWCLLPVLVLLRLWRVVSRVPAVLTASRRPARLPGLFRRFWLRGREQSSSARFSHERRRRSLFFVLDLPGSVF